MDKELNSLLESILLLLIQMLKGFIMGVWHGLRKALQNKWYLIGIGITLVFSVICITEKAMVCIISRREDRRLWSFECDKCRQQRNQSANCQSE